MALKEKKKILCVYLCHKKNPINQKRGGRAQGGGAGDKGEKRTRVYVCTQASSHGTSDYSGGHRFQFPRGNHHRDECSTLTPSRRFVSISPSSEGCRPQESTRLKKPTRTEVTPLFLSTTESPEAFQLKQQSGEN